VKLAGGRTADKRHASHGNRTFRSKRKQPQERAAFFFPAD
jgi:hypothetical protein